MNKKIALLTVVMAAALSGACVEETGTFLVLGTQALSSGQCELNPEAEELRTRGTMDIMLTNRYVMFPLILNSMKPSSEVIIQSGAGGGAGGGAAAGGGMGGNGLEPVQTEGNIISLKGATVSFTAPQVSFPLPQNIFIPTSGSVFPSDNAVTALEVISVEVGNIIRDSVEFVSNGEFRRGSVVTVLVSVKFKGVTSSGTEVESNEFDFPLDICAGCLLFYAPNTISEDDDGSATCEYKPVQATEGEETVTPPSISIPCLIGQDEYVDCRLCRTLAGNAQADAICDPPDSF